MEPQTFKVQSGETVKLPITTVTETGAAKDLTGATVEFHMARKAGEPVVVSTTLSPANVTATIRSPTTGGIIDVTIAASVTDTLIDSYYWECEAQDATGQKATVARGYVTFGQNII